MRDKKKHKNRKSGREKGETYFEEIENINKRVNWKKKKTFAKRFLFKKKNSRKF